MADHPVHPQELELTPEERVALAPPADQDNPAIVDARKTFTITVWSVGMFVGVIVVFILF